MTDVNPTIQAIRDRLEVIERKSRTEGVLVHAELGDLITEIDDTCGTSGTPYTDNEPVEQAGQQGDRDFDNAQALDAEARANQPGATEATADETSPAAADPAQA